jgi:DNA mismatch repair protein MutL
MAKIYLLDKSVAELIAAGEVVERPASVVKELLENSIDAGATAVTVEIKNGGITYIRITDNGCGIVREDVPTAFLRHATSKVRSADDLDSIGTLGFRGEALTSICSVSRMEIITHTADEISGTRLCLEGGEIIEIEDAGSPVGTTLVVRDLFYNTPARMKFLKKDSSEATTIAQVIDRIALSHPEISIKFIKDGLEQLHTPGDNKLFSSIYSVFGREFSAGLIPIDYTTGSIKVKGFTCKPLSARPNRNMQVFYINGRFVKTRTCVAAVEQAYKDRIAVGKFPSCVIMIEMPFEMVDVNVHPAKIEVRFSDEKIIFEAVYYAVKNAFLSGDEAPKMASLSSNSVKAVSIHNNPFVRANDEIKPIEQTKIENTPFKLNLSRENIDIVRDNGIPIVNDYDISKDVSPIPQIKVSEYVVSPPQITKPETAVLEIEHETFSQIDHQISPKSTNKSEIVPKIVGEVFGTYILVENGDELLYIDKHAAQERIIYDELKSSAGETEGQMLLSAVSVTLSKDEYVAIFDNIEILEKAGFIIEDFGGGTVLVRQIPLVLSGENVESIVMEIAGYLFEQKREVLPQKLDWVYHSVACRAAIKAGDKSSDIELEMIVKNLPQIRYCPHGRPVLISMERKKLEKEFGRA